jgi:hypothetical protein
MPKAPLQHVATLGIAIGKTTFHLIGLDTRGAIVLRQKFSRRQVEPGLRAVRPLGIVVLIMAVLVALPIPFGNLVPGLAVFLIALGLAQRDGAAVAAGLSLALLACVVSAGLLYGGWWLFAEPGAA